MATFIETTDEGFGKQLKTFCDKIDTYKVTLGLSTTDVDNIKKDSKYYDFVLDALDDFQKYSKSVTGFKDLLRYGRGDEVLPAFPAVPALGVAPPIVLANIQRRFARIIQDCVNSSKYTVDTGKDLGIEAPVTPFDPNAGKPSIKTGYSSGGHPLIIWKKGKFQGVEIWKDDGTGFKKLERDLSPDYIDKSPLPAAGQSAVWKYKMIYIFKDEIVGDWSDPVTVTVYGNV